MEVVLIIIGIWIVWRIITAAPRRNYIMKDTINCAFVAKYRLGKNPIETPIYWEVAEKFAFEMNPDIVKGGQIAFDMKRGEDILCVVFKRNIFKGTTIVSVWNKDDF